MIISVKSISSMCLFLKVHFETHQKCTSLRQLHFSAILIQTFHILCSLWSWTLIHTQTVFQVFAQACYAQEAFCSVKQFYAMAALHQTHCWFSPWNSQKLCKTPHRALSKIQHRRTISTITYGNPHPPSDLHHQLIHSACSKGTLMLTLFWLSCYLEFHILD